MLNCNKSALSRPSCVRIGVGGCSYMCLGIECTCVFMSVRPEDSFLVGWDFPDKLVGWSVTLMDLPIPTSPTTEIIYVCHHSVLLCGFRGLNSSLCVDGKRLTVRISPQLMSLFQPNYNHFVIQVSRCVFGEELLLTHICYSVIIF